MNASAFRERGGARTEERPHCPRCDGPMMFQAFIGREEEGECWAYQGWRCIQCGEIVDSVILSNRKKRRAA